MHMKRQQAPKNWPVPRKGTRYIVNPKFSPSKGLPILIILRDLLKMAGSRKEVKKAITGKQIMLNSKLVRDEKNGAVLFDVVSMIPTGKHYRIEMSENKKFSLNEIKNNYDRKIAKVTDKKILRGKKTQINFSDGRNVISNMKCNTNDSVLINFQNGKLEKCLELKENANVIVFEGKHAGKKGTITKMDKTNKMAELKISGNPVKVLIKQIMVVE
ncbi:MAG: hypothetical protein AABX28_00240 [Nanoarchaeota archaeon]